MIHHQPTQLALLISLIGIGIGVAPGAHASATVSARFDDRAIDTMQPLAGVTCAELEAATLPACGANADLVWQPPLRNSLDRTATAGVRVLYTTARDDWAPGEMPGGARSEFARLGHWLSRETVQAAAKPAGARDAPRQTSPRKSAGRSRKARVLAQAPASAHVKAQPLMRADAAIERIAQIQPAPSRFVEAGSAQAEKFLDRRVIILQEAPAAPVTALPSTPPAAEASAAQTVVNPVGDLEAAHLEATPASVEPQSAQVLRSLGAILSKDRDEVGAIRPAESQAVVTTQTGKVIAMLGAIAAAQPIVEDGPAKRLRKLAALAAKAEAKAAADSAAAAVARPVAAAAAQLAAEIARDGVDLMLPLESPTFAALLPSGDAPAPAPAPQRVEPAALPLGATFAAAAPRAPRASPFGDRQVAVADSSLDRVRGGFSIDGVSISFGIERAVYVNGALVTTTSLNVSDLGRITAGRGVSSFDVGSIGVIQSGAGNVISPTMISAGSVGTVIQNTLDGQKIQNVTIINATTNSLGVLKGMNLQSSMRGALIDSLRR